MKISTSLRVITTTVVTLLIPVLAPAGAASPLDPLVAVNGYLHMVDHGLQTGAPDRSFAHEFASASTASKGLADYEGRRAASFAAWYRSHGDRYQSVVSTVTPEAETVGANTADVSANVVTTMKWTPGGTAASDPGASPEKQTSMAEAKTEGRLFGPTDVVTSAISTTHHLTLRLENGQWKVSQDLYLDPLNVGMSADHHTRLATGSGDARPGRATYGSYLVGSGSVVSYNRSAAAAYADKYWSSYNPAYLNYNPYGGDCANFVSQALGDSHGANLPFWQNYWYYGSGTNPDTASPIDWRYTPSQHHFFTNNPYGSTYNFAYLGAKGTYTATNSWDRSNMLLGSIHYYDWTSDGTIDHTAIVAAYLTDGTTLIDAHNTNHYRVRYDIGYSNTTYYFDQMHSSITY